MAEKKPAPKATAGTTAKAAASTTAKAAASTTAKEAVGPEAKAVAAKAATAKAGAAEVEQKATIAAAAEEKATKPAPKPKAATKAKRARSRDGNPLVVPVFDSSGERTGELELPKAVFAQKPNVAVMHQAVTRQLANARQGTASTKTRATVSGGGAKPYRQKGTGRARHGSTREPSMKGGANVFGPRPRSFAQRMPRQMRRLALRSALSQKALDRAVNVIEAFAFEEPRTSQAAELMNTMGFEGTTLVVLPAPNYLVSRSFQNLADTKVILARNLNLHDIFSHTALLLAKDSIDLIEETFSPRSKESK